MNAIRLAAALPLLTVLSIPAVTTADDADDVRKAEEAVALFKKTDPSLGRFFEKGKATGTTSLAQVTIGLVLGGQKFGFTPFGQKRK